MKTFHTDSMNLFEKSKPATKETDANMFAS